MKTTPSPLLKQVFFVLKDGSRVSGHRVDTPYEEFIDENYEPIEPDQIIGWEPQKEDA